MTATLTEFPVVIDYSQTFEKMVEAGKYDYANANIVAKNFPIEGNGTVETKLVLVHFDRAIESAEAWREMEQMGLTPAKTEHLLAYGAQHWQRDPEPVAALGSSWVDPGGGRSVPFLFYWDAERNLHLSDYGRGWGRICRFLAVRQSSS